MSLVIPPGFAEASIELVNDGDPDPWFVTLGIDVTAAEGDQDAMANNVALSWQDTFNLSLRTTTTNTAVVLRIGQDGGPPIIFRKNVSGPGTSETDKLPQNCALLVTKQTAVAGRRGKGRFFIPGIINEENCSDVGILSSDEVSDRQDNADAFLTELADGALDLPGTPMVVLHNAGPGLIDPTPVTALAVSNLLATQRRRLR